MEREQRSQEEHGAAVPVKFRKMYRRTHAGISERGERSDAAEGLRIVSQRERILGDLAQYELIWSGREESVKKTMQIQYHPFKFSARQC